MIVLVPLAFVIASYYNGKDGMEELKKLVSGQTSLLSPTKADTLVEESVVLPLEKVDKDTYRKLLLDNESLKDSLVDKELKIRELERNLKLCKGK